MSKSGLQYDKLSDELLERIENDRTNKAENPCKCKDSDALRRDNSHDKANLWRPAFVRDTEKILHLPYYNRYADKTQVFSFYHNDDITRRALHVQLVSRIARNIGAVLGLNLDLIEAIALGHDIGHTPFGHAGERYLSELLHAETGIYFNHNVHSVRVLDKIFARNVSLQTLDGILCHNGEFELQEYKPCFTKDFSVLDAEIQACDALGDTAIKKLVPCTLEGCVVRICDMIAYLGKDRQDALTAHIIDKDYHFETDKIGSQNAAIINNLTVDILENSYGKDYILLSPGAYSDLKTAKQENYAVIYRNEAINTQYEKSIMPMFCDLFEALLSSLKKRDTDSEIFTHHISFVQKNTRYYEKEDNYENELPGRIVADFIASMTDDYFVALHKKLFPDSPYKIEYKGYFE